MPYTNDQLSSMVDALTARLSALDGQGLAPNMGAVPVLQAKVAGQRKDFSQLTVALQNQLNTFKTTITNLINPIRQAMGLSTQ